MIIFLFLIFFSKLSTSSTANDLSVKIPSSTNVVVVHKCCADDELMNEEHHCLHVNVTDAQPWSPIFSDGNGKHNLQVDFRILHGFPVCVTTQEWPIYHFQNSSDRLILLPSGYLRHYTHYVEQDPEDIVEGITHSPIGPKGEQIYYDYPQGTYCMDKALLIKKHNSIEAQGAVVCVPEIPSTWANTDFIVRRILDPVLHVFAILCLLAVAVVYYVLPPLRDLVGNILTSIMICLIISETAELITIFTEFTNHISFVVADIIRHLSLVAAFFWLNTFGYYIWKTFRSRNVFLRVTDGRKFCYYSTYVGTATFGTTAIALTAHYLLDHDKGVAISPHGEVTIGWLGMAMFFTPIACTIIVDIFFYLATGQTISRMSTYGRIHNKMKFSFEMFIKLFLVMSAAWLFLLLSWLQNDVLIYCHIAANALQALLILTICVLSQKRVIYLLKKTCCYQNCICPCCRPDDNDPSDWGEEMMAMNTYNY